LIDASCDRLRALAHKMLRGDRLRRWEETDDVLQQALVRLHQTLAEIQPETVRDFMRLAAWHIRLVLISLARHYFGALGPAANHYSNPSGDTSDDFVSMDTPDNDPSPSQLVSQAERWDRLHAEVARLPADEREVVELMWFHGLTQLETAQLAEATERTVQRRWVRARIKLHAALDGELPGM
jgi:RNA polymerase sigma factor (sigma-70 family)